MLNRIESLDKQIGLAIWRFIHRDGRAWIRRLMMLSVVGILILLAGVGLMSLLTSGLSLNREQIALFAMIAVFTPAIVLYGSLFAARWHGVMGRCRSFPLAIAYTLVYLAFLIVASMLVDMPSNLVRVLYSCVATIVTIIFAWSLGRKLKQTA
tara:strand:+ start:256 stop:714 length:459 start_codon:yes stop_codon:yes gene_type:complete